MSRLALDHTVMMTEYIKECFRRLGRDMTHCELCGKRLRKPAFHHTKYDGATIYDLLVVCYRCNNLPENVGLI